MGTFAHYFKDCGIVAQYILPVTPEESSVAERRNRNLMDMVGSWMSTCHLPKTCWGEALKTVAHSVPNKCFPKHLLWNGRNLV